MLMRQRTLIRRFFLAVCLYYALFVALWGVVGGGYAHVFRVSVGTVFRHCFSGGRVGFQPYDKTSVMWDTQLVLVNKRQGLEGTQPFGTRYIGYASTGMLLSLILATPVPWRRRWQSVALGLVLVHLWIALAVFLMILDGFSSDNLLALYDFSTPLKTALSFVTFVATKSTVVRYSIPTVIWVAVTFQKEDLRMFREPVAD